MPVIPATQEAEAGESLEPGRRRSQRAEIAPLHSSLGDRVRFHLKKKERWRWWRSAKEVEVIVQELETKTISRQSFDKLMILAL